MIARLYRPIRGGAALRLSAWVQGGGGLAGRVVLQRGIQVMSTRIAALVGGVLLATAASVSAQTSQSAWDGGIFVNGSLGVQTGSIDVNTATELVIYDEPGTISTAQEIGSGMLYDITAGLMVRRNLGAALSFSARSATSDGAVTGSIPDPIFFDRPRAITGVVADMDYSEKWLGFLATWLVPAGEKLDVLIMGGPAVAWVNVNQPVSASVTESPAGPNVTLTVDSLTKSFIGVQVGVDVRYMLTETLGVGGFARLSKASGEIQDGSDLSAGGFQVGGGVRVKF